MESKSRKQLIRGSFIRLMCVGVQGAGQDAACEHYVLCGDGVHRLILARDDTDLRDQRRLAFKYRIGIHMVSEMSKKIDYYNNAGVNTLIISF